MKPYTAFEQQVDHTLLGAIHELDERMESDRLAADERSAARFGKHVGGVAAAIRDLEFSIAELRSQVSNASDASAEWQHGLGDSLRGLERHVAALETDVAAQLNDLTDRMRETELRLKQLETPALVSDRARFTSLAALHRAHREI